MSARHILPFLLLSIIGFWMVQCRTLADVGDTKEDALKTAAEMIDRGEKVLQKLPEDDDSRDIIQEDVQKFKDYKQELKTSENPLRIAHLEVFIFALERKFLPILEKAEEKVKHITDKPTTATPTTETPTVSTTGTPSDSTTVSPTGSTTETPSDSTTVSPTGSTNGTPSDSTTVSPTVSTTGTPSDSTTVSPTVSTTGTPSDSTTVSPTGSTTGTPSDSTTVSPTEMPTTNENQTTQA